MGNYHLLLLVPILAACTANYQVNNLSGTENTARLDKQKGVYLTVPADGAYGPKTYPGSGQTVTQVVAAAFSRSASQVHIAEKQLTKEEAVAAAKQLNAGYVVILVITHWEQRATEWSGIPSRMAIRMSIFDTATGNQVFSTGIEGRSRIVSWITTSPESLLKDPVANYVNGLYQR